MPKKYFNKCYKENLDLVGALDGSNAYKGPNIVQIDLTDKCNLNCVGCWCHSYFLENIKVKKFKELPFDLLKKLIEELNELGVKEIMLSGSGEPFMYPQIMEVIGLIKEKGISLNIITNFTLVNKDIIKKMVELNVDNITVSLWAGDADTYVKTHPNQTKKTFITIRKNLKYLYSIKKGDNLPNIKIYNVISKFNCDSIGEMLDFALETKVRNVEFQTIDIIKGKTDFLALSNKNKDFIYKKFKSFLNRIDCYPFNIKSFSNIKTFKKSSSYDEVKEFPGRFIKLPKGFILEVWKCKKYYKEGVCFVLICPTGNDTWPPNRKSPLINEKKNFYIFTFNDSNCKSCKFFNKCEANKNDEIKINYLSIFGFGSFIRRLSKKQNYDNLIIDSIPCYVGWIYTRIMTNGDVIPCCKAHLFPLGNLYKDSFKKIWICKRYNEFRKKAKNIKKSDPYFRDMGCYNVCDNLGMNFEMHKRIKDLSLLKKVMILIGK